MLPLYDVSLSFASEQRDYVRRVSRALQQEYKLRVFFDEERQVELMAGFLNETLDRIFRFQSKWCVIFASKEYIAKKWTKHEGRSILEKAMEEENYLILGKFGPVRIPGIQDTYYYSDLTEYTPRQFAAQIAEKIEQVKKVDRNLIFFKIAMREYPEARSIILKEIGDILEFPDGGGRIGLESYGFLCYNLACVESRLAAEPGITQKGIETHLSSALRVLGLWLKTPAMHPNLSSQQAFEYINNDDDLHFLRTYAPRVFAPKKRQSKLKQQYVELEAAFAQQGLQISSKLTGSNGHCVSADAFIATPDGKRRLGDLGEDTWVISVDIESGQERIATRVGDIRVTVEPVCIRINGELICSRSQRLYCQSKGWISASDLHPGLKILRDDGGSQEIHETEAVFGPFQVVAFTTKHRTHNFFANGYLCHNVK